jgi:hypothetical protein
MILRPATLEIVLNGLITLKDLRALRFTPLPDRNIPIYQEPIITKSRMFHASLR